MYDEMVCSWQKSVFLVGRTIIRDWTSQGNNISAWDSSCRKRVRSDYAA